MVIYMAEIPLPLRRLLRRAKAAKILDVPPQTMAVWACNGFGPPVLKFGRMVRYDPQDLRRWIDQHRVSEGGEGQL